MGDSEECTVVTDPALESITVCLSSALGRNQSATLRVGNSLHFIWFGGKVNWYSRNSKVVQTVFKSKKIQHLTYDFLLE